MANVTKGSQVSNFPDSLPSITEQSEARDSVSENALVAEGRDYNIVAAEIEAIAKVLGIKGRAYVSVTEGAGSATATIEPIDYVYQGTSVAYAGTTSLALTVSSINYIYLDCRDNTVKASTSAWPTTEHIQLAIWDDSGSLATLTDERPHDLKPTNQKILFSSSAGEVDDDGKATILNGNTFVDITFNVTFTAAPNFTCFWNPADATFRDYRYSNLTTTGVRVHTSAAAGASGIEICWRAKGTEDTSGST